MRFVRIEICTSGDPVSESPRLYSPISSCFRSFVMVIHLPDLSTSAGQPNTCYTSGAPLNKVPTTWLTTLLQQHSNSLTTRYRINMAHYCNRK